MGKNELSNSTLGALLVIAIFVSLGGTMISLNKIGAMRYTALTGAGTFDLGDAESVQTTDKVLCNQLANKENYVFVTRLPANAPEELRNSNLVFMVK